jgi:hypothetical protein
MPSMMVATLGIALPDAQSARTKHFVTFVRFVVKIDLLWLPLRGKFCY